MAERKRIREPPTVPYVWELRPGIPNKDWKPNKFDPSSQLPISTPPLVKLIASVPFNWEEKPGTPLPSFVQSRMELTCAPCASLIDLPLPPNVRYQPFENYNDNDDDDDGNSGSDNSEQQEMMFNMDDLEDLISELSDDESFSSAESSLDLEENCFQHDISADLETDNESICSYATGASSLVGAKFLERLFPLRPPNSSVLGNAGFLGDNHTTNKVSKDLEHESNTNVRTRNARTLGELILMSRRMSYHRKAVQMRKDNLSMEFMKRKAFGCFNFRTANPIVGLLEKKRPYLNADQVFLDFPAWVGAADRNREYIQGAQMPLRDSFYLFDCSDASQRLALLSLICVVLITGKAWFNLRRLQP
ncbi:hypothetical protein ACFE04_026865 [Oxalis oulophora]